MAHLPITQVKLLATAVAQTANAADGIFADGAVNLGDLGRLPGVLNALKTFVDVDYSQVVPQLADIDMVEAKDLAAHFSAVFNIKDDKYEVVVEQGLALVLRGIEVVAEILAIAAKIKAATV